MGNKPPGGTGLTEAVRRAEGRTGKIPVSGRYHRLPKRIEDDYNIEKKVLGTGYNGSVFKAKGKSGGGTYAVKGFHLHGVSKEKMAELETEAEIFLSMDHPHVARLVGVYECDKQLNLVMECMEGGEVFERVLAKKRFHEKDAAHAVWQMLLAVNYIHSRSVVHRDLKLENFLYEKKDGDHLKLIDFGFSHIWEPNTKMALSCGTLAYVAPEVLAKSYTSQCDLWSLGVVSFILLFGYMPFSGPEEEQIKRIKIGAFAKKPDKWAKVSSLAQEFVMKLLQVDPAKRLSAEQALAHPFIKNHMEARPDSSNMDDGVADALIQFAEASKFRRACMSVMAWSLTNEERAQVRNSFIAMDKNSKGTITLQELKTALMDTFDVQDSQIMQIFEALDTAGNDEIHYSEFLAAMVSTRIAMHDDLLTATFRKFDVDNSGHITVENLRSVLGETFDGAEVEKLIREADRSQDGQLSYDEFIQYLKEGGVTPEHEQVAGAIIDQVVVNEHVQTKDELAAAMPKGFLGLKLKMKEIAEKKFSVGSYASERSRQVSQDSAEANQKELPTVAFTQQTSGEKGSKACVLL